MFIAVIPPCQYSKIIYIIFMNICIVSSFSLCLMILLVFMHVPSVHIYTYFQFLLYYLCSKVFMFSVSRDPIRHLSKEIVQIILPLAVLVPGFLVGGSVMPSYVCACVCVSFNLFF